MTGPDEYTALVDNNVFTNLMAARNLRRGGRGGRRATPSGRPSSASTSAEIAAWRRAADAMVVPVRRRARRDPAVRGLHPLPALGLRGDAPDEYPLLLHYPYYLLYSSQVVKQADLVFALYLCGDRFDAEQKRRDFDYYEAITVRDSSLSASIQAIVAAEVGHLDLAYDYFRETALVDLRDLAGNTADGLHLASLAGAWLVAVAGFGGLRDHGDVLAFAPRLPPALTGWPSGCSYRGRRLAVEISPGQARYELLGGEPLDVLHHGSPVTLVASEPQTLAWTARSRTCRRSRRRPAGSRCGGASEPTSGPA